MVVAKCGVSNDKEAIETVGGLTEQGSYVYLYVVMTLVFCLTSSMYIDHWRVICATYVEDVWWRCGTDGRTDGRYQQLCQWVLNRFRRTCILGRGVCIIRFTLTVYLRSPILHRKVELTRKFRGAHESPKKESLLQWPGEILFRRLQRFLLYVVDE
jgi:hypothetical protein